MLWVSRRTLREEEKQSGKGWFKSLLAGRLKHFDCKIATCEYLEWNWDTAMRKDEVSIHSWNLNDFSKPLSLLKQ